MAGLLYTLPVKKGFHEMNAKPYIQQQIANARGYVDAVVKGITDEQFTWSPPGTLSPIGAIFLHMLAAEDYFIHALIQGKPTCWIEQDWGQKTGVQNPPEQGCSWDEFKTIKVSLPPVLAYQQVVRGATDDFLADLTEEELQRQVNFAGHDIPVAEVFMTMVVHIASHAGEMAAIKGMQGLKGLPF
jgi:uncharacterized damage-inducible protein DinB